MVGSPPVADALDRAGFEVMTDPDQVVATLAAEPMALPVFAAVESWPQLTAIPAGSTPAWVSIGPGPHPAATIHGEVIHPVDLPATVEQLISVAGGRAEDMVEDSDALHLLVMPEPEPELTEDDDLDQPDDDVEDLEDTEPPAPRRLWNPQPYLPQPPVDVVPQRAEPAPLPYAPQPQRAPQPASQPTEQPYPAQYAAPQAPGQTTPPQPYPVPAPAPTTYPGQPAYPQAGPYQAAPTAPVPPAPAPYQPVHQPVTRPDGGYDDDPDDLIDQVTAGGDRPSPATHRRGGGQVVIVGAGKGGVGKSTFSQALAATAAAAGLKVVLVDANVGQANQLSMLGVPSKAGLPTIIEAATTGDIKQAFLPPSVLNLNRDPDLKPVRFVLVAGPPRGRAAHPGVTPELYLEAVRYAQKVADLVVIDTQIVEDSRDDSGMIRRMMLPVLTTGGWFLCMSDDSREGLIALQTVPKQMVERGVPASHLMTMVNMLHANVRLNAKELARRLESYSRLIAAVPYRDELKQMSHRRETLDGTPALANPLEQVLELVSGVPVRTAADASIRLPEPELYTTDPQGRRAQPAMTGGPAPQESAREKRWFRPFGGRR